MIGKKPHGATAVPLPQTLAVCTLMLHSLGMWQAKLLLTSWPSLLRSGSCIILEGSWSNLPCPLPRPP